MSGIETAFSAFGTLKSAYDLVRDLRKSNDPATLKSGIEELTERLLSAREDALGFVEELESLRAENASLKAQLVKAENFVQHADKFERAQTGWQGYVYKEKIPSKALSRPIIAHIVLAMKGFQYYSRPRSIEYFGARNVNPKQGSKLREPD